MSEATRHNLSNLAPGKVSWTPGWTDGNGEWASVLTELGYCAGNSAAAFILELSWVAPVRVKQAPDWIHLRQIREIDSFLSDVDTYTKGKVR